MGDSSGQYTKLPPGWDCKYDQTTGNCYYINYFTKAMQLEDPRMRYKQLQNERCSTESIVMQPMHGSPYHVYPTNNYPAVRAFQAPAANEQSLQNISSSPLLSSRSHLEMSPLPFSKTSAPQTPRPASQMSRRSTVQETSFTNPVNTDAVVTKIQNMFPTASEHHIRLLLKRYMKTIFPKADETLLLDILANSDNNVQTASEKLLQLGYVKRDFVPPKLNNRVEVDADGRPKKPANVQIIPLHPKEYSAAEKEAMKLRLQGIYKNIAERIILMALESVNYAEERAMQILQIVQEEEETLEQKAVVAQKITAPRQKGETVTDGAVVAASDGAGNDNLITVVRGASANADDIISSSGTQNRLLPSINVTTPSTTTTQIILSHEEPAALNILQKHASPLVTSSSKSELATSSSPSSLSSAYSSQSYETITTKSILERRSNSNVTGISGYLQKHGCTFASNVTNTSESVLEKLKLSRSRDKSHSLKNASRDSTDGEANVLQKQEFNSILGRMATMGHSVELTKGPNDSLLLADYVTWNGANPNISLGHKQPAVGADAEKLSERTYIALGRNADLCKGPQLGLAKGSIYAQLAAAAGGTKSANIKCN